MIHWLELWVSGLVLGATAVWYYHRHSGLRGEQHLTVWYGVCWIVAFYALGYCLVGWWTFAVTTITLYSWSKWLDWRAIKSIKRREQSE